MDRDRITASGVQRVQGPVFLSSLFYQGQGTLCQGSVEIRKLVRRHLFGIGRTLTLWLYPIRRNRSVTGIRESMASRMHCVESNSYSTQRLFNSILHDDDEATVHTLLQEGADIDARNSKGYTPLLLSCFRRRREIVELLLASGANVECCNGNGYTVFHYAARHGWTDLVRSLMTKVHDLNVQDNSGETAMHHASRLGKLSVVKCLVEEGADINRKNFMDFTPLLYAAQNSYKDIVDLLLNSNANFDGSEGLLLYYASRNMWSEMVQFIVKIVPDLIKRHGTALMTANGRHVVVVNNIFEEETDRNKRMFCQALLHETSYMGHLDLVKSLVKKAFDMKIVLDLNARFTWCRTALLTALHKGHLEVVKYLVEEGADVNTQDEFGETALHTFSSNGHPEMVKYFVENGADITISDECGLTALHHAARMGYFGTVTYLVEKGADINICDEFGDTVLHKAIRFGCLYTVIYLIIKGTDINVQNFNGFTPILIAIEYSHKNIVDLLMHLGAKLDGFNRSKCTMLHIASALGWIDTVHFLVKKGCDLDARDVQGITALGSACLTEEFVTAQFLLQAGASWDIVDEEGDSPLNYLTRKKIPKFKPIKLFIDHGAYLKHVDCDALVKNSSLKVLQDIKLCCRSILNKFNNHDLLELYKLSVFGGVPCIEKLKIASGSEVAQAIERNVEFEIQTKGHCSNLDELCPMALGVLSVRSILKYYLKQKLELKNHLKLQAAFDSKDNFKHSSKSMHLINLGGMHVSVPIKSHDFSSSLHPISVPRRAT